MRRNGCTDAISPDSESLVAERKRHREKDRGRDRERESERDREIDRET